MMNTYQKMERKFLGLAFFLGPILLISGSVASILGIDRSPVDYASGVEGMLHIFGALFMLPVLLELAKVLGERAPIWGIISKLFALAWATILIPFTLTLVEIDLVNTIGLDQPISDVAGLYWGWIPVFIVHTVSMFTPLVLGIAFLITGGIPRRSAILMIAACISLGLYLGLPLSNTFLPDNLFFLLMGFAWLFAFIPLGVRYWVGDRQPGVSDVAVA